MSNNKRSPTFHQYFQASLHHKLCSGVNITCSFVKNQYLRISYHSTGKGNKLLLSTGEPRIFDQCIISRRKRVNKGSKIQFFYLLVYYSVIHILSICKIISDSSCKEHRILRHDGDSLSQRWECSFLYVLSIKEDIALDTIVEAGDHVDDSSLTCSRWADEGYCLTAFDWEREVLYDVCTLIVRITESNVSELYSSLFYIYIHSILIFCDITLFIHYLKDSGSWWEVVYYLVINRCKASDRLPKETYVTDERKNLSNACGAFLHPVNSTEKEENIAEGNGSVDNDSKGIASSYSLAPSFLYVFQKSITLLLGLFLCSERLYRPYSCIIFMDKSSEVWLLLPEVFPVAVSSDDYKVGRSYQERDYNKRRERKEGVEIQHHAHNEYQEDQVRDQGWCKALCYFLHLIAVIDDSCDYPSRWPGIKESQRKRENIGVCLGSRPVDYIVWDSRCHTVSQNCQYSPKNSAGNSCRNCNNKPLDVSIGDIYIHSLLCKEWNNCL